MTLLELQRTIGGALFNPRSRRNPEALALIRGNDRLTSRERLDIYSQSYWCRVLDSLFDDFQGLHAVLGSRAFNRLAEAYLSEMPSQSFTLRDLGSRLPGWLASHPSYGGANAAMALDMARLEWAHVEAFDGPSRKPLGPEDLLELGPEMKFRLQPHISLLELQYPVDDLRITVQPAPEGHSAASNAVLRRRASGIVRKFRAIAPAPTYLAVHRVEFSVYYRRLEPGEFRVLGALGQGVSMGDAVESLEDCGDRIEGWFAAWSRLGWFCAQ